MKIVSFVALFVVALAVAVLSGETRTAEAMTCDPAQLAPCVPALVSGAPTAECCSNLKEQQPCLCQYMKDPAFSQFVTNPAAKKIASVCNVPWPVC
ncbi:hypothetical protein V6N13_017837 [Hibiscus sabdariffa]|uniref:Bifunctional inhibitor/plant lipid transfer protein/seed storage helical domain-containing protein n=1 Tax=Hibiscus sabdariffa TaxID=183260 RepID=A0ABR2CH80_9ROSI